MARLLQYEKQRSLPINTCNTEFIKEKPMKAKNIENNLALAGALIVLIGVSFAAEDALGFEDRKSVV